MIKPYLLDNEPKTFRELIKAAQNEGYESADGFYRTSAAASYLRELGYKVESNPDHSD